MRTNMKAALAARDEVIVALTKERDEARQEAATIDGMFDTLNEARANALDALVKGQTDKAIKLLS